MSQTGYTPIVTYNSSTASTVPAAGNLATGELAVNVTDKKIYTKDGSGVVVQVAGGPAATETLTNKTIAPAQVSDLANTSTGFFDIPVGTTSQRPVSPTSGQIRYNTDTPGFEGYGSAWGALGGGGGNTTTKGMWENANSITADYTITTNNNAVSTGPITVASGISVVIPSGSRWIIL